MSDLHFETVRCAIALRLEVRRDQIAIHHRLEEDLGLDLLDVILVVLHIEELENEEFPMADLEGIRTVRDLVALVQREGRTGPVWDDHEPPLPPRRASGIRRAIGAVASAARAPRPRVVSR